MRVPIRQAGPYARLAPDRHLTQAKYNALQKELAQCLATRPAAIAEVQKHAFEGDFSENAPYQIAKGRLRGLNQKITNLEESLRYAEIIDEHKSSAVKTVTLGCQVTLLIDGQEKTFRILGSAETNPAGGIISHRSPIGAALLGHQVGDLIKINNGRSETIYKIIKIS